jgi:hypothetical protein
MNKHGKGRVVGDGGFISTVRYQIEIEQQFTPTGTPTFKQITLNLFDRTPEIPLSETPYTLEMEGGQTLKFFVRSIGVYEPTGGIQDGNELGEIVDFTKFQLGLCSYGEIVECPSCRKHALFGEIIGEVFRDYVHVLRNGRAITDCSRREHLG